MMKTAFKMDEDDKCLPFTLDLQHDVVYVTKKNLTALDAILSDAYFLGIDTETRPSFFNKKTRFCRYPTSIIQIAARTKLGEEFLAIIDLLDIGTSHDSLLELDSILLKYIARADVYKMGQGLENDLREICVHYPCLSSFSDVPSIIDTNALFRVLHPDVHQDVSLKNLALTFLHSDLIKTQQCSDWARRPLTDAQFNYAARDALVLLRLFDAMSCEAVENGDFNLSLILRRFQYGMNRKEVNLKESFSEIYLIDLSSSISPAATVESIHIRFEDIPSELSVTENPLSDLLNDHSFNGNIAAASDFVWPEGMMSDQIDLIGTIHQSSSSISLSSEDSRSLSYCSINSKKSTGTIKNRKSALKKSKPKMKTFEDFSSQN